MKFIIKGVPPKKDRPRFTKSGSVYSTSKTTLGEALVKWSFLEQTGRIEPIKAACKVSIKAFYTMPKSWSKKKKLASAGQYKTTKPDTDNIIKAILDGLNGVAYVDDNLVAVVECCKQYADSDYTEVEILEL